MRIDLKVHLNRMRCCVCSPPPTPTPPFPTRAQAVGSWSKDTCCQGSGNTCYSDFCSDHTSSADFLFRLQPGNPQ